MQENYVEILREHWQRKLADEQEQIAPQLQLYVPAMLGSSEKVPSDYRKDAMAEIQQFLNSDNRLMLLLGDSGAGKTLFGQWLTNDLWEHQQEWIPIFIHLPAYPIKKGYFEKYLRKQCELSETRNRTNETAKENIVNTRCL